MYYPPAAINALPRIKKRIALVVSPASGGGRRLAYTSPKFSGRGHTLNRIDIHDDPITI